MQTDQSVGALRLRYHLIRNITSPEEAENGAATYSVVMPASEIVDIGTEGNLRRYIPEHNLKKRSMVHRAIADTIRNKPDRFTQFNSGFLVGASKVEVDDQKKVITLWEASINNGAQSQGEIRLYHDECKEDGQEPENFNIRAEISVEPNALMRTEIAIARNTATRIQDISSAGAQGYFNGLSEAFSRVYPDKKLAKSETDVGDDFVDTRMLLQVLWALMPDELVPPNRKSVEARMRSYKNAAACLDDFGQVYRESSKRPPRPGAKREGEQDRRYQYFIDMVPEAWRLYSRWHTHPDWEKMRLREDAGQVKRKDGKVDKVADGVLFPIISALSRFVTANEEGKWVYKPPQVFREYDIAYAARRQLKAHGGKPMHMGRSSSAYEALFLVTEMAQRFGQERPVENV